MCSIPKFVFVLLLVSASSFAADLAVLRNGNSIRHEKREIIGSVARLYLSGSSSGYIEIPIDQIERFETDTNPAPPVSSETKLDAPTGTTQTPSETAVVLDRQSLNLVVNAAGQRHQIDPDFINSVIRAESGFNSRAVSKKGAQGLMQLMPGTASKLGVSNSFDPNANVEGGTKYLRELLEKYNYDVPKALAAYNAGPGRVDRYRGVPPYFETRSYVANIIRDYNRKKLAENPSLAKKSRASARRSASSQTAPRKANAPTTTADKSMPHGQESAAR